MSSAPVRSDDTFDLAAPGAVSWASSNPSPSRPRQRPSRGSRHDSETERHQRGDVRDKAWSSLVVSLRVIENTLMRAAAGTALRASCALAAAWPSLTSAGSEDASEPCSDGCADDAIVLSASSAAWRSASASLPRCDVDREASTTSTAALTMTGVKVATVVRSCELAALPPRGWQRARIRSSGAARRRSRRAWRQPRARW